MRDLSVPSQTLLIPATTVAGISLVSGRGVITGWALRETTNAGAAELDIIDGQRAGGNPLAPVTLDPHESTFQWFGVNGLLFQNGLFVNVTTGTIRGGVFVILEEMMDIDGRRILFGQSDTGHFMPAGVEIDYER